MRKTALTAIALSLFCLSGCTARWELGEEPFFRWGERVRVINNLQHTVFISYRPGGEPAQIYMDPGQEGVIYGVRADEHLVAQVLDRNRMVIGTTDYRIRSSSSRRTQLWRINNFRRLR